jgi:hypothetical protein
VGKNPGRVTVTRLLADTPFVGGRAMKHRERLLVVAVMLAVSALLAAPSAQARCLYYNGQPQGATQGVDGYFFRVSSMHLTMTLSGHWQAGPASAQMIETDVISRPPKDARHPSPYSPPFTFSWPDCSLSHNVNVYGPDAVSSIPYAFNANGTWSDPTPDDAGDPTSGTCQEAAQIGDNDTGPDLLGNLVTLGETVTAKLVLAIRNYAVCSFGNRPEFAAFNNLWAGNPGELRFRLSSKPVRVSVATIRRSRSFTLPLRGQVSNTGPWGTEDGGATYGGGTAQLHASWSGSMTLALYARCDSTPAISLSQPGELHCHTV